MKLEVLLAICFLGLNILLITLLGIGNTLSFLIIAYTIIVLASSYKIYIKEYKPTLTLIESPNKKLAKECREALERSSTIKIPLSITERGSEYYDIRKLRKKVIRKHDKKEE